MTGSPDPQMTGFSSAKAPILVARRVIRRHCNKAAPLSRMVLRKWNELAGEHKPAHPAVLIGLIHMLMIKSATMTGTTLTTPPNELVHYSISPGGLDVGPEADWDPEHLTTSAWIEHIPFAFWIIKTLRPSCFVELGTERGVSYAAFCQAVERLGLGARCYAVDTWRGDEHSGHYDESVFSSVVELNERRYRQFSSLLRMTFHEALAYFADGEIDLLHIDGLHTYAAVAGDFASWRPKLSDRAVVLFHDTNVRRDDFGVWRLWRELQTQFPSFEFSHGHGLGVLGVGQDLPASIRPLFEAEAQADTKMAVRSHFAARGASVHRMYDLRMVREETNQLRAEIAVFCNENAALQNQAAALREESVSAKTDADLLRQRAASDDAAAASLRNDLATGLAEAASLREQLASASAEVAELRARLSHEIEASRTAAAGRKNAEDGADQADKGTRDIIHDLQARLAAAEAKSESLLTSTCWRITAPLRMIKTAIVERPPGIRTEGQATKLARRAPKSKGLLRELLHSAASPPVTDARARDFPPTSQLCLLQPRVLIVAELSLPQCKKYRVDQKRDMINALGWDCSIVAWQDTDRVLSLMQTHSVVIFYRAPAFPDVLRCMDEADSLGLPHYFELDDLIFDLDDYAANPNLLGLDATTAKALFDGAVLYQQALERCRNVIASTPYLAERMQGVGGGSASVIENALDSETLSVATTARRRESDGKVCILYGSGTRTHDADFASIAPALRRVAMENPNVEIVLVGELNPPPALLDLDDRLRQMPACRYPEYLALLAASDIAIAPLSPVRFNDAKSNIKFLEAASVGVPSVCSPRSAFVHAVRHNETGLLAETPDEWHQSLMALVADPDLRRRMGEAARADVLEHYNQDSIAHRQLAPLLSKHVPAPDRRLHILQVNILFRPQSFGGATIVMEHLIRHLHGRPDTRVSVFTSAPAGWVKPYAVERSEDDGVTVFRIGLQDRQGWLEESWDETAAEAFREVLRALRPDVVHFHAVQGIGAASLQVCHDEAIPFVVTLHDAWWVCERQFLVTGEGQYCGQQKIRLNVCASCVANIGSTVIRNLRLRHALDNADLLLTPSQHWRRFHLANGFAPDRVVVNENGIPLPAGKSPNRASGPLRFGFVAGAEAVKGFPLLKRTFEALQRDDWELILINHGLSVGIDSYAGVKWKARGTIRVVPPFKESKRDAFYDSIDVLLFPSQWPESFGLTVREALVRDKWVIVTDQGGAAEAVTPNVNGTLIPMGDDIAPFLRAVEDLLDRKPDLAGWVNPVAHRIRDFATQSAELRDILATVASRAPTATAQAGPTQAEPASQQAAD
jgi:O-antigen biosynthesis protein